MVLSGDESVGGGALSWDIDIHNVSFVVLHLYSFLFELIINIKYGKLLNKRTQGVLGFWGFGVLG